MAWHPGERGGVFPCFVLCLCRRQRPADALPGGTPSSVVFVLLLVVGSCTARADQSLTEARRLLATGRYAEARAAYAGLESEEPLAAAIGVSRCERATGRVEAAHRRLKAAIVAHPDQPALLAEAAGLAWQRGDYALVAELTDRAIQLDKNQVAAHWWAAESHRVRGQMTEAEAGYAWLIDYYNRAAELDAEQLYWIGQGAAQYARWTRNSRQFDFLVNSLYPEAVARDKTFWQAKLAAARLFAEKYNMADAKRELAGALAINPNAAEAHAFSASLAVVNFDLRQAEISVQQALEINPNLLAAKLADADIHLADLQVMQAINVLEEARQLNPRDEATLGRLAAAYGAVDGFESPPPESRLAELTTQVLAQNPHCGHFFMAMGDSLDRMRRYPDAARYYRKAARCMPRLMYAKGQLGLVLMRLGEEDEAARLLEESFAADPFNVRVKNMLEVLDLLQTYDTLETEHFIFRFDPQQDRLLAEFAARYMEQEAYPEIVTRLGYEPPGKSLFEFFSRARNTSGHSWFSARMVGLPFIGTVAACAGKMVAIASPNEMDEKYDYFRVLKHEFVHVVNLQQTRFNIPHWFTEALAVLHEGLPRPTSWDEVLARRAAEDDLLDLNSINLAFIRPKDRDDWTLAYCQAELYAQYMLHQYGDRALAKMLEAYAKERTTEQAIRECFGVAIDEFEVGYRRFVDQIVTEIRIPSSDSGRSLSELQRAVQETPEDADLWAELALAYLQRGESIQARKFAMTARRLTDNHPLAGYVLARLYLSIGDTRQAVGLLQESLDESNPQENVLALMAGMRLRAGQFDEAERLYRIGVERWPGSEMWLKSLARVYLKSGDTRKLRGCLKQLAQRDYDNFILRKKLLELAIQAGDEDAAIQWGRQAVRIDVMDAETHAMLAEALTQAGQLGPAMIEWDAVTRLDPDNQKAKRMLEELRKRRE